MTGPMCSDCGGPTRWRHSVRCRPCRDRQVQAAFAARSDALIDRSGGPDACWRWMGSLDPRGYGRLASRLVHRETYQRFVGPIPAGFEIDHLCRNTSCCNPAHLEPVSPAENRRRQQHALANERTHCQRGHEYATPFIAGRTRHCPTCTRERHTIYMRSYRPRRKAVAA